MIERLEPDAEDLAEIRMKDAGYVHKDDLPDIDNLKFFFKKLLDAHYKMGTIDEIEDALEEIAGILDLPIPEYTSRTENKNGQLQEVYNYIDSMNSLYRSGLF